MFRDANYHQRREDLCEENAESQISDCCMGEPIGECRECGWLVCETHGVTDAEGDAWCNEHAPVGEEDEQLTITPLQVVMLAELAGVRG